MDAHASGVLFSVPREYLLYCGLGVVSSPLSKEQVASKRTMHGCKWHRTRESMACQGELRVGITGIISIPGVPYA